MRIKLEEVENKDAVKTSFPLKIGAIYRDVISWMNRERRATALIVSSIIIIVAGFYVYSHFIASPKTSVDVNGGAQTQQGKDQLPETAA